jgi:hypothetical protein
VFKVAVLVSGGGRASIFFVRRVGLNQANAPDGNGLDNKEKINGTGYLGYQAITQKAVVNTKAAVGVLIVTLEACQLRAAGPGAIFREPARALSLSVGVPQYAVGFRRQ